MAVGTTNIIVVAQAEGGDALQQGVVVEEHAAPASEGDHVVVAPEGADAHGEVLAHEGADGGAHEVGIFPPFDASSFAGQAFWLTLTFGFLYVLMSRAALPRIGGILEQRRTRIDGDLREAERLRLETERAIADYEQALSEARQHAHGIAEETRQSIKADIEGKRTAVETDLAKKLATAEAGIAKSMTAALTNVDAIAAELAGELVSQLTEKVTPKAARDAVAAVAKE